MYQIDRQSILRKKKKKYQKLHSVKIFNFNAQWSHQYQDQIQKDQLQAKLISKNYIRKQNSKKQYPVNDEDDKYTNNNNLVSNCSKGSSNEISLLSQQIYPKKKALSQLQSYKKLDFSNLKSRFSKPTQSLVYQDEQQRNNHHNQNQQELEVKSKKLVGLKLPQIKSSARQNRIIKKFKLQNLKVVNIHERIKTMKYSQQKQDQEIFSSQIVTEALKYKMKNIEKNSINIYKDEDQNKRQKVKHKKQFFQIQKIKKKVKQITQAKHKSSRQTQIAKIHENKHQKHQQQPQHTALIQQDLQAQKQKQKLPFVQVYDKKMKIGRKKKSQQDRIRAMLLKTLQKTKGSDYVAQRGTSQTYNSSLTPNKKSLSKNSKEGSKQKQKLVLQNNGFTAESNTKNQNGVNKKFSFKKVQLQKIRKSLKNPSQRTNNRQNHQMSSINCKNKKFVQMVRQVQNNKNKKAAHQLQQIKQENTIHHEDDSANSQQKQCLSQAKQSIKQQDKYLQIQKSGINSQQMSENEFIPTARRQKIVN